MSTAQFIFNAIPTIDKYWSLGMATVALYAGCHYSLNKLIVSQLAPKPLIVTAPPVPVKKPSWKKSLAIAVVVVAIEVGLIVGLTKLKSDWFLNGFWIAFQLCWQWHVLYNGQNFQKTTQSFHWTSTGTPSTLPITQSQSQSQSQPSKWSKWTRFYNLSNSLLIVGNGILFTKQYHSMLDDENNGQIVDDLLSVLAYPVGMVLIRSWVMAAFVLNFVGVVAFNGRSIRNSTLFFYGYQALVGTIIGLIYIFPILFPSVIQYFKSNPSSTDTTEEEKTPPAQFFPWVQDLGIACVRSLMIILPGVFIGLALKFDWSKHVATTGAEITLQVSPSPQPRTGAILPTSTTSNPTATTTEVAEVTKIQIPKKPFRFPRPYFKASIFTLILVQLTAIHMEVDENNAIFVAFGTVWLITVVTGLMALRKGDLKSIWKFEEVWKLPVTPEAPELADSEEKAINEAEDAEVDEKLLIQV